MKKHFRTWTQVSLLKGHVKCSESWYKIILYQMHYEISESGDKENLTNWKRERKGVRIASDIWAATVEARR